MRRALLLVPVLLAGCSAPPPQATVVPAPRPPIIIPVERGDLIGLTQSELATRLGPAALTVREGEGLKLQWRGATCVLDAYLYADNGAAAKTRHVEARTKSGIDTDQAACLSALSRR